VLLSMVTAGCRRYHPPVQDIEGAIRSACEAGELNVGATCAIEGYGAEVLGFLVASLRSHEDAGEVFAMASEDMWRGLPNFRWECSFRTWFYCLARNAAARYRRGPHERKGRFVPLSAVTEAAARVRTQTLTALRTEARSGLAQLREELDPTDQELLILRLDRKLSWDDIARVLCADEICDAESLRRASARLRKRLQLLKRTIRERARAVGLLPHDDN